jgi:hypothetical protein
MKHAFPVDVHFLERQGILMAGRISKCLSKRAFYILTLVAAHAMCLSGVAAGQDPPPNEKFRADALEALKEKNYDQAIEHANQCVEKFRRAAERNQKRLADKNVPLDLHLNPLTEELKKKLFSRGPLNDVGACYFVLGEANRLAAEELAASNATKNEKLADAKKNYEKAAQLTYSVIYDPGPKDQDGAFFWSPAEAAQDALDQYFAK